MNSCQLSTGLFEGVGGLKNINLKFSLSPIITAHSNKSHTKKNEVSTNVLENFKVSGLL